MTPEAVQFITEWWVNCLVWLMAISALPVAAFVALTVFASWKEMRGQVKRERSLPSQAKR